jgi:large subunit ribosomal protein L15
LLLKELSEINKEVLLANKVIRDKNLEVKLLAKGELKAKLTVVVDKASASAKEAVEKA